jgi:hypothetical protein
MGNSTITTVFKNCIHELATLAESNEIVIVHD